MQQNFLAKNTEIEAEIKQMRQFMNFGAKTTGVNTKLVDLQTIIDSAASETEKLHQTIDDRDQLTATDIDLYSTFPSIYAKLK